MHKNVMKQLPWRQIATTPFARQSPSECSCSLSAILFLSFFSSASITKRLACSPAGRTQIFVCEVSMSRLLSVLSSSSKSPRSGKALHKALTTTTGTSIYACPCNNNKHLTAIKDGARKKLRPVQCPPIIVPDSPWIYPFFSLLPSGQLPLWGWW